jgi:hypothetical protein
MAGLAALFLSYSIREKANPGFEFDALIAGYDYNDEQLPVGKPQVFIINKDFKLERQTSTLAAVGGELKMHISAIGKHLGFSSMNIPTYDQALEESDAMMLQISKWEQEKHLKGHIGVIQTFLQPDSTSKHNPLFRPSGNSGNTKLVSLVAA